LTKQKICRIGLKSALFLHIDRFSHSSLWYFTEDDNALLKQPEKVACLMRTGKTLY
jgi:hypothetical protein